MASNTTCTEFNVQEETVLEFIERFKVQCSAQLEKAGEDGVKKAGVLVKALPVKIITDLQRRIKPTLLSEATYATLVEKLTSQYEMKKSFVGAAVTFLNRKQLEGETIEHYAKVLNDLASSCKYKDCCSDRMIRDVFVSGISSRAVMSTILQDCEDKSFDDCVLKAKLLEQVTVDAQDIKLNPSAQVAKFSAFKIDSDSNQHERVNSDYVCIRCNAKGKHLASKCYALKLKCNECSKTGHIARACRNRSSTSHRRANAVYTQGENVHIGVEGGSRENAHDSSSNCHGCGRGNVSTHTHQCSAEHAHGVEEDRRSQNFNCGNKFRQSIVKDNKLVNINDNDCFNDSFLG